MNVYGVKEMADSWAKKINKITVVEGTNDDWGVDNTLDADYDFYKVYEIDEDQKLLSMTLSVFVNGYLVFINTRDKTVSVADGFIDRATRNISIIACSKIEEYYCPTFATTCR